MLNKVSDVNVLAPHVLRVTFADGFSGVHDFRALAEKGGGMAALLRDAGYFARVFLEYGALTWPNGYDMCPDWLRMEMDQSGVKDEIAAAE